MDGSDFTRLLMHTERKSSSSLPLEQGSRVAVIGGGPAGSLFSFFLLDMADRIGLELDLDIYEPRDFTVPGPTGCNMCGGVLYESLVQSLAVDGINLPETVVQRGIGQNMLHLDVGSVLIATPRHEKRIATTFRGIGPRGLMNFSRQSLDGYLLTLAVNKGARHIRNRVADVRRSGDPQSSSPQGGLVQVKAQGGEFQTYGLLAVSTGVNTSILKLFREMDFGYEAPQTAKLLVREYYLGDEDVSAYLGSAFHAFLLDIPGLDYGAIIPKGDYMTVCLLSSHSDLHSGTLDTFLEHPAVKSTLPPDFSAEAFACWCGPRINVVGSKRPFDDRIVFIGDSGVSRLYKDGIGAAYRTAKAAARTAVFQGVSAEDFKRHYLPLCREIENDNRIGKSLFMIVGRINKIPSVRHAVLRMVAREQKGPASLERHMSMIVWDMLTGGAPYREVLVRLFRPVFQIRFLWNLVLSVFSRNEASQTAELTLSPRQVTEEDDPQMVEADVMKSNVLGKVYQDGEVIFHKGDVGDFMLVIQDGQVEVVGEVGDQEVRLAVSGPGEVIGEMAIFEHRARSATVRALGSARVLTVDEKTFLRYVHQDPSLAFQLLKMMSKRVRKLGRELTHLTVNQRSAEEDTKKWPPARSV